MSYTKDSVKSPSYLDTGIFDFSNLTWTLGYFTFPSRHLTWTLGYLTSQVTILPGHLVI